MAISEQDIKTALKNLGITRPELEKLIHIQVGEIVNTKVAKWKAEGRTGITQAMFNKTVNAATDEIIRKAKGEL